MAEVEAVEGAHAEHDAHTGEVHRHPAPTGFIRKYIFSVDHKVIGIQYLLLAMFSVFVGLILSVLMRFRLTWPTASMPGLEWFFGTESAPGGVMNPEVYLALVTMHGTMMSSSC